MRLSDVCRSTILDRPSIPSQSTLRPSLSIRLVFLWGSATKGWAPVGTWGSGPFENDAAMDFVGDLADASVEHRWQNVLNQLTAVTSTTGYLESAEEAVAAAAMTAAAASSAYDAPSAAAALSGLGAPPAEVIAAARAAIARLREPSDNELFELWREAGSGADLLSSLAAVETALA